MIKVYIRNMSCGHCQIKIHAELKEHGYPVIEINMQNGYVLLDTSMNEINKVKNILDHIHYYVDKDKKIEEIKEYIIWDNKFEQDVLFEKFTEYLIKNNIILNGFNDKELGVICMMTHIQYQQIKEMIKEL